MAQTIQLKRSAVASNEPTTVDLGLGELAINTYDGKVFFKKDNGTEYILRFVTEDQNGNVGINEQSPDYRLDINGPIGFTPGASVTPVDNGDVVFEFTSNTSIKVKGKGSDATVREFSLPIGSALSAVALSGAYSDLTGTPSLATVATTGDYDDLTGKPTIPIIGVNAQASASSLTPNVDTYNIFRFTALAANLTINAPTGTPYDGQRITFQFTDDGTEQTLTWDSAFKGGSMEPLDTSDPALPDSTYCDDGVTPYRVFQKTVIFEYNSSRSAWVGVEAYKEDIALSPVIYVGGKSGNGVSGMSGTSTFSTLTGGSRSDVAEGDLVVLTLACASTTNIDLSASASGYTQVSPELYSNDTWDTNLAIFYKFMGSTPDSNFPVIFPSGTGTHAYSVRVYAGVDQTTPLDVAVVNAQGTDTGLANPGAITPSSPNAVIIVAAAGNVGSGDYIDNVDALTEFHSETNRDGSQDISLGVGHTIWSSGAFDPSTITQGGTSTSYSWAAYTLALRPASLN